MEEIPLDKEGKFLFLRDDLKALIEKRELLVGRHAQAAKDSGEACRQSSETFHDNFPFEQAMRDMQLYSKMIDEIEAIVARAEVIDPLSGDPDTVRIGCRVRILDLNTDEYRWLEIGSYVSSREDDGDSDGQSQEHAVLVSYRSPIGRPLMGKKVHDTVDFAPPKRKATILLISQIVPPASNI
jgi:transcription elongation factor GreA